MRIVAGDQAIEIEGLSRLVGANAFPDILFFATAEVLTAGGRAKVRIKVEHQGTTLASWTKKTHYQSTQGETFGDIYDSVIVTDDTVAGDITLSYEVRTDADYVAIAPTSSQQLPQGHVKGGAVIFETAEFVGSICFMAMV